jgi:hypothetical protein
MFNISKPLNTDSFIRIGDLSYFEGPLLSLFEDFTNGHLYLFDWVDRDEKSNRWLIYRTSPNDLLQFMQGKLSHLELYLNRPDEEVFFSDIDSKSKLFFNHNSFQVTNLPISYLPLSENYFELSDCNQFEKIRSVVVNLLSKQKSKNEYSIGYRVEVLKSSIFKLSSYNRVVRKIGSVKYEVKNIDLYNIEPPRNLSSNHLKFSGITKYVVVQKSQTQNKKHYANQYN